MVRARQHAIPYALDALEIAQRQTQTELKIGVAEKVIENEQEKAGVASEIETKVATAKATKVIAGYLANEPVQTEHR